MIIRVVGTFAPNTHFQKIKSGSMQLTREFPFVILVMLLTCGQKSWTEADGDYGTTDAGHYRSRVTFVWYTMSNPNHSFLYSFKQLSEPKGRAESQDNNYLQIKERHTRSVIKTKVVNTGKELGLKSEQQKLHTQELPGRNTALMIEKGSLNISISIPDRSYQYTTWNSGANGRRLLNAIYEPPFIKKDSGRKNRNEKHSSGSKRRALQKRNAPMHSDKVYNRPSEGQTVNGRESYRVKSTSPSKLGNMYQSSSGLQDCPVECLCRTKSGDQNQRQAGTVVDCSNRRLTKIPDLPATAVEILLQDNLIEHIPCRSFIALKRLNVLDISDNQQLKPFSSCAFNISGPLETLNLRNCSLGDAHLPGDIFDSLHQLKNLDLSKNALSNIRPSLFKRLNNLQQMNLYNNSIARIKNDTFMYLPSLRFLSLQRNLLLYKKETFEPRAFSGLVSLYTLNLQGNEPGSSAVVYPDEALSLLPWLRELTLDGYAQQPLGQGFARLSNLIYLSFGRNMFGSPDDGYCLFGGDVIPADMFSNVTTRNPLHLNMSGCGIDDIHPEVFSWLPTLYLLDLSYNFRLGFGGFEKLSQGLTNSTIEILNLTAITPTPEVIPNIINDTNFRHLNRTSLKIILLESNRIFSISPQAMIDLPETLEYLSLYDNILSTLNIDFYGGVLQHINLKTLVVSRQNHPDLGGILAQANQSSWSLATSGSFLTTDDQKLTGVNSTLAHFSLATLAKTLTADMPHVDPELMRQKVEVYDYCAQFEYTSVQRKSGIYFLALPMRLEYLFMNDIGFKYDFPLLIVLNNRALKHIEYKDNYVKCMGGPLLGLPSLEVIDFTNNGCLHLNPAAFQYLSSVKTLLLQNNNFGASLANDVAGTTFSNLTNLETLDLSNNAIKTLSPVAFKNNLKLQTLNLSQNSLRQFVPRLLNMFQLRILDLSGNSLEVLSKQTCNELIAIKSKNADFTAVIGNNSFICDCNSIDFLLFLVQYPEIFAKANLFSCHLTNGSEISYNHLEAFLSELGLQCIGSSIFTAVLGVFLVSLGCLAVLSLYFYKRWQWSYLYHVGKSRLHIGSTLMTYMTAAQVFLTYDQDDLACRLLVRNEVIPRLRQAGISYLLGETDFGAGPLGQSIAGAVTCTIKTVVLLSRGIFEDHHRELEVNLAIMHELHMRRPVLVPILLLARSTAAQLDIMAASQRGRCQDAVTVDVTERSLLNPRQTSANHGSRNRQDRTLEDDEDVYLEEVTNLVDNFPPDISAFLYGQSHRCLLYEGSSPTFWSELIRVVQSHDH